MKRIRTQYSGWSKALKNVLVTGGAGFIGSNFVRYLLSNHDDVRITNVDKLTYAGNLENLTEIMADPRHEFVRGDICDREFVATVFRQKAIDVVVHFAAESHVDRSIYGSEVFVRTNIQGTNVLLEAVLQTQIEKFILISTDEVYGSLGPNGKFTESSPLCPSSPYAASKAGADLLAFSYYHTHSVPVIVTRCSNNYGPYQFPEKLIPLMIINALLGKPLPVYGDGMNVRDWLFVDDHCSAVDLIVNKGVIGETYNISGENEWRNIDVVKLILDVLQKPETSIVFVKDRPGHDRRYALDATKLRSALSWSPSFEFANGLTETIRWYRSNERWWQRILSGEYQAYYRLMYENR
jgi:dTDP-glucose 4,6-dehydratase